MERKVPEFLTKKIYEQYDENEANLIISGLQEEKKTSFRLNRIKTDILEVENILNENKVSFERPDFFEDGFIIEKKFEKDLRNFEIYEDGKIYLQSLSSMIPVLVLNPQEKENILDMCSAPRRKDYSNSEFNWK